MKQFSTLLLLVSVAFSGWAGVPEPDNVIYGLIYLGTNQVTARNTNVLVEAWLTTNGPTVASYPMGSLFTAGNFYSLRLSLENADPTTPAALQDGEKIYLVVVDPTGIRYQQQITVSNRLAVQRIDFQPVYNALDTNQLPLAWETFYYGRTGLDTNALGANGQTLWQNYVVGTSPLNSTDVFMVSVSFLDGAPNISFPTRPATGAGYLNVSRHYALDSDSQVGSALWSVVPGYSNILGLGQTALFISAPSNAESFYRGRVWLQSP
jgi:hypothetical protein